MLQNNIEFNLEYLIDEYARYVFKIVDNIISDDLPYEDKEEVVSDTFYLLWKNQDKIDTNLKSYLSAIARNCAYDKLRKNNFEVPIEDISASKVYDLDSIIEIKEMLKRLSEEEKIIFELYYLKGFKVKEISVFLNKSASDIKIRLYRLRKKMKEGY